MNLWGWLIAAIALLTVLWQLGQAVLFGRMGDVLFEEEDYLYFFDSPILFSIQLVFLILVGGGIVYLALKEYRKHQLRRMDSAPRQTFDARKPSKDR